MELVPCGQCKRHVSVTETRCPFCASGLMLRRSQFVLAARVTRAAIFSAAIVACGDSKQAPTPTPAPAAHQAGSDDELEKMLDGPHGVATPLDARMAPDATELAAAPDAGVPIDAGVDPAIAERRRKERERIKRQEALRRQHELEQQRIRIQVNNKPYGAPPARRRVV